MLAEAGHPNGLEAGAFYCDAAFASIAEAVVNNLREVGIRTNLQPVERAAFYKGYGEKKFKNLIMGGSAAFGNAATRLRSVRRQGRRLRL